MASEISTIQSLKAVDAWIDVINANINGGVRTAFKSSRLKFSGSNVDIQRAGTTNSLPLQMPEPGLTTANTVIDFSQGAITASTENTHLAIQGEGFFLLASPDMIDSTVGSASFGMQAIGAVNAKFFLTRDGEFRTDQNGFLRAANGYYLVTSNLITVAGSKELFYNSSGGFNPFGSGIRAVYNDIDNPTIPATGNGVRLTNFLQNGQVKDWWGGNLGTTASITCLVTVPQGKQSLQYSTFGSTVWDIGWKTPTAAPAALVHTASIGLDVSSTSSGTILSKSLEASNASMTQSVPELSLAQKLFSALTKVLQTKQTNVDGVLNLVR
jgi:flagellar hook protein FlgE